MIKSISSSEYIKSLFLLLVLGGNPFIWSYNPEILANSQKSMGKYLCGKSLISCLLIVLNPFYCIDSLCTSQRALYVVNKKLHVRSFLPFSHLCSWHHPQMVLRANENDYMEFSFSFSFCAFSRNGHLLRTCSECRNGQKIIIFRILSLKIHYQTC